MLQCQTSTWVQSRFEAMLKLFLKNLTWWKPQNVLMMPGRLYGVDQSLQKSNFPVATRWNGCPHWGETQTTCNGEVWRQTPLQLTFSSDVCIHFSDFWALFYQCISFSYFCLCRVWQPLPWPPLPPGGENAVSSHVWTLATKRHWKL